MLSGHVLFLCNLPNRHRKRTANRHYRRSLFAFGTTGLSLGITGDLSGIGQIAALMFIGRIGMLYTLLLFVPKETQDLGYEYPTEQIIIG